jgi:hypothetical protein
MKSFNGCVFVVYDVPSQAVIGVIPQAHTLTGWKVFVALSQYQ